MLVKNPTIPLISGILPGTHKECKKHCGSVRLTGQPWPPLVPCGAVWGWNWAALVASERKRLCFAMGTCFNQMAWYLKWGTMGYRWIPDTSKIHQYHPISQEVTTFVRRFMNYNQLSAGPRGSGSPLCSLQRTSRKSKPIARQCLANRIYIAFLGLQCEYILKKNMGI